jgi:hypothetical protein
MGLFKSISLFGLNLKIIFVMILLHREPKEDFHDLGVYERCYFCKARTDTWDMQKNQPICVFCAQNHDTNEVVISHPKYRAPRLITKNDWYYKAQNVEAKQSILRYAQTCGMNYLDWPGLDSYSDEDLIICYNPTDKCLMSVTVEDEGQIRLAPEQVRNMLDHYSKAINKL